MWAPAFCCLMAFWVTVMASHDKEKGEWYIMKADGHSPPWRATNVAGKLSTFLKRTDFEWIPFVCAKRFTTTMN